MSQSVLARWHALVREGRPEGLADLLDPEVVFHSPVVHAPQQGRALTSGYLAAAFQVLVNENWRYVGEWHGPNSAVLEFQTRVQDVDINGVDIIHWNDEGRIVRFKVMLRPLKAINLVREFMARALAGAKVDGAAGGAAGGGTGAPAGG